MLDLFIGTVTRRGAVSAPCSLPLDRLKLDELAATIETGNGVEGDRGLYEMRTRPGSLAIKCRMSRCDPDGSLRYERKLLRSKSGRALLNQVSKMSNVEM
jgi:hypothetical protein